ncbi:subtilisin-like protein [Trametes versicolor FP-101664 SS1]|uniref:subtilisin-like protein n=1 Tax=Trametes versicolor (strain FP-101664) TaxID=717944 RepID=UPI0004624103|nr:subtilisin-like protein [Trametes versicolor FP-101664 SS1]EIW55947.1 subtilisin-like protein [Trametes versicolor FP-101664 SS1]
MAIGDPTSPTYGQHLSKSQVAQLAAPAPESMAAVTGWLQDHGLTPDAVSSSGDMLTVRMSLEKANSVLNANYSAFVHTATNTTMWRTLSYSVPAHLDEHLSFVYPTTQFIPPPVAPAMTRMTGLAARLPSKRSDQSTSCAEMMTPKCLQALYNIPATPATAAGNGIAIGGSSVQVADLDDLRAFLSQERPDIGDVAFTLQSVNGTIIQGNGTDSASTAVSVQYAVGLATNVSTTVIYPGPQDDADGIQGLLDITNFLLAQDTPPLVFLTNVQYNEAAFQQAPEIAQSLCNAFAQLGARGISVIAASGNSNQSGTGSCNGDAFHAMFPASCPYVTAVGSTRGINTENAADFSSGGFSDVFLRPAYQLDAVAGYMKQLGSANASSVNTTGRAYPDVSAQGSQFVVEVNGPPQTFNSTSASSATFAAVVALLNDRLLNAGKPPLGFLNPLLYSKGLPALNDIVSGSSSPSCGARDGLAATPGWDPATGLGTPDFQKLLAIVVGSDADADRSGTVTAGRRSSSEPTTDVTRGSSLEGLFPFATPPEDSEQLRST